MSALGPAQAPSSIESRRRFKTITAELAARFPREADLILQTSIKRRDAARLEALLHRIEPRTILEIGSYCGVSTRWLLSSLPEATVECVDPWLSEGVVDVKAVFDAMVAPYRDRVLETRAYFACRNNQAYSVSTSDRDRASTRPGAYKESVPVFRPRGRYDLVFVDADHRTSSSITAFMTAKEHSRFIIYHDANLASHAAAFDIIAREWAGEWIILRFPDGEDGLALLVQSSSVGLLASFNHLIP